MNKRFLNVSIYMWVAFFVLSLVFITFSQIDIYISSLFFNGKEFPLNNTPVESFFYYSVKYIVIALSVLSFVVFLYNKIKKTNFLNLDNKAMTFIFLSLIIAPGLIVNWTLKDNWGRARPAKIKEFGGKKEFSPAFVISNQNGYSFSSGHTAAAFSLMAFAMVFRKRWFFWLVMIYGGCVSIARIGAGGHFLSDVVTSFFIVWITTHIFYKLIFKEDSYV